MNLIGTMELGPQIGLDLARADKATARGVVLIDPATGLSYAAGAAARSTVTATIANAASVSGAIDLSATALVGFIAPAAWTAAALNLEVSMDNSTWATAVMGADNAAVGSWSAVVAGNAYAVDVVAMLPFRYVRFRSGTSAAPVNQGASRAFTVITRPLA